MQGQIFVLFLTTAICHSYVDHHGFGGLNPLSTYAHFGGKQGFGGGNRGQEHTATSITLRKDSYEGAGLEGFNLGGVVGGLEHGGHIYDHGFTRFGGIHGVLGGIEWFGGHFGGLEGAQEFEGGLQQSEKGNSYGEAREEAAEGEGEQVEENAEAGPPEAEEAGQQGAVAERREGGGQAEQEMEAVNRKTEATRQEAEAGRQAEKVGPVVMQPAEAVRQDGNAGRQAEEVARQFEVRPNVEEVGRQIAEYVLRRVQEERQRETKNTRNGGEGWRIIPLADGQEGESERQAVEAGRQAAEDERRRGQYAQGQVSGTGEDSLRLLGQGGRQIVEEERQVTEVGRREQESARFVGSAGRYAEDSRREGYAEKEGRRSRGDRRYGGQVKGTQVRGDGFNVWFTGDRIGVPTELH